jgi:hypothetical protein
VDRGTSYLICGLDPPFFTFEYLCADELPALSTCSSLTNFPGPAGSISYMSGASDPLVAKIRRTGDRRDGMFWSRRAGYDRGSSFGAQPLHQGLPGEPPKACLGSSRG